MSTQKINLLCPDVAIVQENISLNNKKKGTRTESISCLIAAAAGSFGSLSDDSTPLSHFNSS